MNVSNNQFSKYISKSIFSLAKIAISFLSVASKYSIPLSSKSKIEQVAPISAPIFVIVAFISVFFLAKDFFNNSYLALISVLILEGLFFYNYTSPEFNVNISQLCIHDLRIDWLLGIKFELQVFN